MKMVVWGLLVSLQKEKERKRKREQFKVIFELNEAYQNKTALTFLGIKPNQVKR